MYKELKEYAENKLVNDMDKIEKLIIESKIIDLNDNIERINNFPTIAIGDLSLGFETGYHQLKVLKEIIEFYQDLRYENASTTKHLLNIINDKMKKLNNEFHYE